MTRPIPQIVSRRERFRRLWVWHPINTDPTDDNRWGPRFWYPVYDLIAIALGLSAFNYGSPLLNRLYPVWFVDSLGLLLIVAGLVCLIGVLIPKVNLLELIGKCSLVFLLAGYAGTVAFHAESDGPNTFVVIALVMAVWLLGPRITVLSVQYYRISRQRQEARKQARLARKSNKSD